MELATSRIYIIATQYNMAMPNEHVRNRFGKLLIFIIVVVILVGVQLRSTPVPVNVLKPAIAPTDNKPTYRGLTSASTLAADINISTAATSVSQGDSRGMNTSTTSNQETCTNYKSHGYLLAVEYITNSLQEVSLPMLNSPSLQAYSTYQ